MNAAALGTGDVAAMLARQTEVTELIAAGHSLADVLDAVVLALEALMPGSRCSILLLDHERTHLLHGAAPSLPAEYCAAIHGLVVGPNAGSCGTAAHLGEAVIAVDVRTDPRWADYRDLAAAHDLQACWSSPIDGPDGIVGTFALYHDRPYQPNERDREVVGRFRHMASIAIAHDVLFGALAESEERFRRVFDDNPIGMALAALDGRLVRVNLALHRLLGVAAADAERSPLLDQPLRDVFVVVDDRGEVLPADPRLRTLLAAADRPGGAQIELDVRRLGGTVRRVAIAASTVRDAQGAPSRIILNVVDLTQRRVAERERRARLEAEVAQRTAEAASRAKSSFLATLSHELRTPLQAITGLAEALGMLELSGDQRQSALGHIRIATDHILSLVDDVLDIARIEAGALQLEIGPVVVGDVVDDVLGLLAPLARQRDVTLRAGDGAPALALADRRRLRQVLMNLAGNAIRYAGRGADVTIEVASHDHDVRVAVRDDGPGIAAELMERMFVPFDRLGADEGREVGAGLGLVLARQLLEAMGGRLAVDSVVGEGTVATATLLRA